MSAIHNTAEWAALAKRMRPVFQGQIDQGMAVCIDCGRPLLPGEKFQVGHRMAASTHPQFALADWNLGPSHSGKGRACNQRAGGAMGAAKTNAQRVRRNGMIEW